MKYFDYEIDILKEIKSVLQKNPESSEQTLVKEIIKAKQVFVCGAGRSGLMAKAFAMRLMQVKIPAFVVGETTTPSIKKNDLLILISGSGTTLTIIDIAKEAKVSGARIVSVTANKKSELGKLSDSVILLSGKTKKSGKSIQPLGSLFEQSAFIFFEAVIIGLAKKLGINEKTMKKRHASLE